MMRNDLLHLRAPEPEDVDLFYNWENDVAIWGVSNTLVPFSRHQLKKYIDHSSLDIYQSKQLRLIIELNEKNQPVGMIDLFDFDPYHNRAGIGIILHKDYRGKGYALSALELFKEYVFMHIGLHQIYATITDENHASKALFEKSGFTLIGIRKDWMKTPRGFKDELFYQFLND